MYARTSVWIGSLFVVGCLVSAAAAEWHPPALKIPDGFVIELVAGPPLVDHPTMAGFDDQGRLYVCDGPGLNLPAKQLLRELPNKIRRLEDTDGDGRFDKAVDYADKMTFPMGALWHRGAVYTASPPNIWRLEDTDGDGVADKREILVSEFGFNGNAADIHGCFLGPDGRLYWCDGRHGHTFVDEHGNQISKGLAARLFRCRLDGKQVETFAGGGMDNPVEVTFTEQGEPLGTVAIFDIIEGRHDALVHWVYGGAYPRYDQRCVEEFQRTGELLPPVSRFVGVAPSGVTRYRGNQFGPDFRDNIFLVQFNTHTLVRTQLTRDGGSFRSVDQDFVTSTDPDFHPTDVLEDADGSLLVIDTGGWFRIGCPTSQVAKPEIQGGIYRLRKTDRERPADPRGLKLDWADANVKNLVGRLSDARPAVRDRAVIELASRGAEAVEPLRLLGRDNKTDSVARGLAIWTLARIDTPAAREGVRLGMTDRDPSVRQIAVCAVGTARDAEGLDLLCELVESDQPQIRREAASALGRIGARAAVPVLLSAVATAPDRFVEHSMIYALIQLDDTKATAAGLADKQSEVRRAALIALDQMPDGNLTREQVLPLLTTKDLSLLTTAFEVIERHQGWASGTIDLLSRWAADPKLDEQRTLALRTALVRFAREPRTQEFVAGLLADPQTRAEMRLLLLNVVADAELAELPTSWLEAVGHELEGADPRVVREALSIVAMRRSDRFDDRIEALAKKARDPGLHLAAIVLLAKHGRPLTGDAFKELFGKLGGDNSPVDQLQAAEALGSAKLNEPQRKALLGVLPAAGPLELPALVQAFDKASDPAIGKQLIAALEKSSGTENLSPERLHSLFTAYPSEIRAAAEPLTMRLNIDLPKQRARLAELAPQLEGGRPQVGRNVFFGKKALCSACHRVRGEGSLIGPDLTKVGQIRSRSDLIESVVFPSTSFARGYESFSIQTDSGFVYTGVIARETSDSVYVKTAQREEIRVPRSAIEQMVPSKVSIMPQGFDKLLSVEELRDVLAYLQTLR